MDEIEKEKLVRAITRKNLDRMYEKRGIKKEIKLEVND